MQLKDLSSSSIVITIKDRAKGIYYRYNGYDLDSFGLYYQGLKDSAKALDVELEDLIERIECQPED